MLVMNVPMKNQPKIRPVLRVSNPIPLRSPEPCARESLLIHVRACDPAIVRVGVLEVLVDLADDGRALRRRRKRLV